MRASVLSGSRPMPGPPLRGKQGHEVLNALAANVVQTGKQDALRTTAQAVTTYA